MMSTTRSLKVIPPYLLFILSSNSQNKFIADVGLFHKVGLGSKQTLICSLLSAAVLLGLVANAVFGWTWADALAALVIGAFAIREGIEAWNGDTCATAIGELMEGSSTHEYHYDGESHP